MTADRKKPGVAFWATVVLVVALAYPLSFGPACWLASRTGIGIKALRTIYRPIVTSVSSAGEYETFRNETSLPPAWTLHFFPSGVISRYATFLAAEGWCWRLTVESEDQSDLVAGMREGLWELSNSRR
jgi:hypothetical protein